MTKPTKPTKPPHVPIPAEMAELIKAVCYETQQLLLEKNASYGNSAADPIKVFSKLPSQEQINVRIDDKLSRIARGSEFGTEDTEQDLIGYLILKRIIRRVTGQ